MRILIAVPSKNRAQVFNDNILAWLKFFVCDDNFNWIVFLEKQDVDSYFSMVPDLGHIVTLEESNQGLGYAKQQIKNYAQENGYDYIFKVDDDVKGWTDFRQILNGEQAAMNCKGFLWEIGQLMEKKKQIGAVSFPYSFQMFEQFDFKKTKRVQTAYITRLEDFHADPKISVFEDFAVGLQAIVKYKLVLQYGKSGIVMGVKVGGGTGGHQSFDRQEKAHKEIEELRKIYPPLAFRRVNKIWGYEPDLKSVKIGRYL